MISLIVDGDELMGFTQVNASRSVDNVSGEFSFSTTFKESKVIRAPILVGSDVQLIVDQRTFITGYISGYSSRSSKGVRTITYKGFDYTKDLVSTSINSELSIKSGLSLKSLCDIVIKKSGLNIRVINKVGDIENFKESENIDFNIGDSVFSVLEKYARKRQVLLNTDGRGNLVITRRGDKKAPGVIMSITGDPDRLNNVISSDVDYSSEEIYSKYIVRSAKNPANELTKAFGEEDVNVRGEAQDKKSVRERTMEIEAEESMDSKEALDRAKWEANIRRSRAINARFKIAGHSVNGKNWGENTLVDVVDDFHGIDGEFLISSVSFKFDKSSGSTTSIAITNKDAYTLEPEKSSKDKSSKLIEAFTK